MSAMNGRERVLAFFDGQPVDRLPLMPVVMMFCADQIGVPYGQYVNDYHVLAQAQMQTAEKFDFDIVSIMSDPAREAFDCGAHVEFYDDQPAAIVESDALLADKSKLARLPMADPHGGGRMHAAVLALEQMKSQVGHEKVLMGWVEGPCAEAADLRGINTLMLDFFDDPTFVQDLFDFVVEMELRYAKAQIEAGADLIGIGDAAASLIGPKFYREFVWSLEKRLVDGIHAMGAHVRLHICGNTNSILQEMGQLGCQIVDLDYPVSIAAGRQAMGAEQILLGNINPVASPAQRFSRHRHGGTGRMPSTGRPPLHRRGRLRSCPRYAAAQCSSDDRLRPRSPHGQLIRFFRLRGQCISSAVGRELRFLRDFEKADGSADSRERAACWTRHPHTRRPHSPARSCGRRNPSCHRRRRCDRRLTRRSRSGRRTSRSHPYLRSPETPSQRWGADSFAR